LGSAADRLTLIKNLYYNGNTAAFARALGYDKSQPVQPYLTGDRIPGRIFLERLEGAGFNPYFVTTGRGNPREIEVSEELMRGFSGVVGGAWPRPASGRNGDILEYLAERRNDAVYLEVERDVNGLMVRRGDVLVLVREPELRSGDVVMVRGERLEVRRYYRLDGRGYALDVDSGETMELGSGSVLGRVVSVIRRFDRGSGESQKGEE